MHAVHQILAVTSMNLRGLPQRIAPSLVVVTGIAGVVGVLLAVLALSQGLSRSLVTSGRADRALLLHAEANSEAASALTRDSVSRIIDSAGIARDARNEPIASAEVPATLRLPRRSDGALGILTVRGVGEKLPALRPEILINEGRMPARGLNELIAGRAARSGFAGLDIGQHVVLGNADWTVVGSFESGGDAHESELLADADTLLSAYQRASFNAVTVKLLEPAAFDTLNRALAADPALAVTAMRESDYYQQRSQKFAKVLAIVARLVAAIMAIGAVFAALNSLYSVVSARTVEIATLRAIGFGGGAVMISVMAEALLLALVGACAGAALTWLLFDGHMVSTVGGGGVANVIFRLHIGGGLIAVGMLWACAIGLIGGLLPAIRAARLPIDTALRAQ
ncbi:MAG: transporter permease [Hydrocarboniphaga sp.]|uniref:ABC transporter permease n=1 Tax=Hydrocarboniphaga sp. TaxID=2033016 RepID=UPI00261450CD|nr:ABC transporter permease [Hydrocarboniphaga sp.]MDB5967826.1 transporter permease [Hydrocarboniphaga sp.]